MRSLNCAITVCWLHGHWRRIKVECPSIYHSHRQSCYVAGHSARLSGLRLTGGVDSHSTNGKEHLERVRCILLEVHCVTIPPTPNVHCYNNCCIPNSNETIVTFRAEYTVIALIQARFGLETFYGKAPCRDTIIFSYYWEHKSFVATVILKTDSGVGSKVQPVSFAHRARCVCVWVVYPWPDTSSSRRANENRLDFRA